MHYCSHFRVRQFHVKKNINFDRNRWYTPTLLLPLNQPLAGLRNIIPDISEGGKRGHHEDAKAT